MIQIEKKAAQKPQCKKNKEDKDNDNTFSIKSSVNKKTNTRKGGCMKKNATIRKGKHIKITVTDTDFIVKTPLQKYQPTKKEEPYLVEKMCLLL